MTGRAKPFPWPWLILAFVVTVATLAAIGGWAMGQRDYPVEQRAISGPVAAGAQFSPPHGDAPAVPYERAVAQAEDQMAQETLPDQPEQVTYGHLTVAQQGIDSDVWLVTFPGYCTVSTGLPASGEAQGIAKTLVAVNATTGNIITTLVDVAWRRACVPGTIGATVSA
jgi:hypothetical protein